MSNHHDQTEAEKMAAMHVWLAAVREELELDPDPLANVTDELLDLIRVVAHGPSRPGAPLTAFLVGYMAGRSTADPSDIIAKITALAEAQR